MGILLICPLKETIYGYPVLPRLGLAYLSASLTDNDIEHDILDLNLYNKNWGQVLNAKIEKYSSFGITSTTFEFDSACKVAKHIKSYAPYSKIILGGPHATLFGEEVPKNHHEFDYCFKGEGEESLPKLVHLIDSNCEDDIKDIKGICYREYGEVKCNSYKWINNLDNIPIPNYDKFELDKYEGSPKCFDILTSRGCPFSCIYCTVSLVTGKKFRVRSPENVITEMEYLITKYGTSSFSFNDDNFTLNIDRAKKICRYIIDKGLNIKWRASNGIRADRIDEELVCLMKKSGCTEIAIGIESTNNNVLHNLKKATSIEITEKAISLLQKYKIPTKGFFLIGSPGETKNDVYNYLEFAIQKRLNDARFNMLIPYPKTELWNWVENNRYWTVKNPQEEITKYTHIGNGRTIYRTPSFSAEEKEKTYQEVWENWEKYTLSRSLKGRVILRLRGHPHAYDTVRNLYQLSKRLWPLKYL